MVRIHENWIIAAMIGLAVIATLAGCKYIELANRYAILQSDYAEQLHSGRLRR